MPRSSKINALIALEKLNKNVAIHTAGGFITGRLDSISKENNPQLHSFRIELEKSKPESTEPSSIILQDVTITNAAGVNKLPFILIFIEDILGISLDDFESQGE